MPAEHRDPARCRAEKARREQAQAAIAHNQHTVLLGDPDLIEDLAGGRQGLDEDRVRVRDGIGDEMEVPDGDAEALGVGAVLAEDPEDGP